MKDNCKSCIVYKKYGVIEIKKKYFCKLDWDMDNEKCDYIKDENEMERLINNRTMVKNIIQTLENKVTFYRMILKDRYEVSVDMSIKWENYSNDCIIKYLKDIK